MPKLSQDNFKYDLVVPTISINGTLPNALVGDALAIIHALRDVDELYGRASPHGRDYKDFDDFKLARDAWLDRRRLLATLIDELEVYAYTIASQDERRIDTKETYL